MLHFASIVTFCGVTAWPTSGQLPVLWKKNFFPSKDNCNCWILEQSEKTSYFLRNQEWFLRQNEKKKICAKEWSKKHIFHSCFFIFHHKPKRMLKFLQNGFWIVIVQKIQKKGFSHLVKMTLGVVQWRHELDYILLLWVLKHTCAEL